MLVLTLTNVQEEVLEVSKDNEHLDEFRFDIVVMSNASSVAVLRVFCDSDRKSHVPPESWHTY